MKNIIVALSLCAVAAALAANSGCNKSEELNEFDYEYRDGRVYRMFNNTTIWYEDNLQGAATYGLFCKANIRPVAQTANGKKFCIGDEVWVSFSTQGSRRLWESALSSACGKMVEWLDTAAKNNVETLKKEIPESAFKDGLPIGMLDWIDADAKRLEKRCKLSNRSVAEDEFAKKADKFQFQCSFDKWGGEGNKFSVNLSLGRNGVFPFELFSGLGTVEEIRLSVQRFLMVAKPESLARALKSHRNRISIFEDGIEKGNGTSRLKLSDEREKEVRESANYERKINDKSCWSGWFVHDGEDRCCAWFKGTGNNWNYALVLGEDGFPQKWSRTMGWYDYEYDYHLISFPTENLRRRWYEVIKGSCDRLLEWMELAAKKDIPVVTKVIYDSRRDGGDKLIACYDLIAKGSGQKELVHNTLQAKTEHPDRNRVIEPIVLIGYVSVDKDDTNTEDVKDKSFDVYVDLKCGDKYFGPLFRCFGAYERIQRQCVQFLYKIDPEAMIGAWNEKYGRGDLFK